MQRPRLSGLSTGGLAELGEADRAARHYPQALALIGNGTPILRDTTHLTETLAAITASAGARWEKAEGQYRNAFEASRRDPLPERAGRGTPVVRPDAARLRS